ncbi:type II toxin-antitoxin system HicA family toxin [Vibrio sp. JC009]|uniref:type II toxin-antitoxin system HicA family toxin n=1 Tax=Vibrio sp. JC009 TaxID=2912314 RepID=UPI0023AECC59|nr:type II toxin-antitoxin system HicA family toxin [Vibrio sp. JC009]WED21077.1 type II toxin-antitoxin system HicA family toxin [Vibrio sp. JC009]
MSKQEKLKVRLLSRPKDFTWNELQSFLRALGFEEFKGSGSRRKFFRGADKVLINLHEPHPDKVIKQVYIKQVVEKLIESGDL